MNDAITQIIANAQRDCRTVSSGQIRNRRVSQSPFRSGGAFFVGSEKRVSLTPTNGNKRPKTGVNPFADWQFRERRKQHDFRQFLAVFGLCRRTGPQP